MPTAVALIKKDDSFKRVFCSGTILSKTSVVTAAHCLDNIKAENGDLDIENLLVVAGEADMRKYKKGEEHLAEEFNVKRALIHPHYHLTAKDNLMWDIALLELNENINIESNPYMKAAVLPPPELRVVGKMIKVGGWGQTAAFTDGSHVHKVIDIKVHPHEKCKDSFGDQYVKENMFCAGQKRATACPGDSGAGAVFMGWDKPVLMGIVSYGKHLMCTEETGFQNVIQSLPWIYKKTGIKPEYEMYNKDELFAEFMKDSAPSAVSFCQNGWTLIGSNCYKRNTELLNWNEAENKCKEHGGHLASVHSEHENRLLRLFSKFSSYWLGGSDSQSEGVWLWSDSTSWNFTNWPRDEPNNKHEAEHCLEFKYKWNDNKCSSKLPSVCKKPFCKPGWTLFGANCYKVFDEKLSWQKARKMCIEKGAQLASVHSAEEHKFLHKLVPVDGNTWLGGSDLQVEGLWEWTDKTRGNFSAWHNDRQPDNHGGNEHCLVIQPDLNFNWNDGTCGSKLHSICKMKRMEL